MVAQLLGLAFLYLTTSPVAFAANGIPPYAIPTSAVEINPNWEVVYRDNSVYGVVGKAVILECGSIMPDMYIWSFTQPGTEAIRAVVYNLGKGPRIQKLAETLGQMTIISNSAAVSIEKLPLAAHGLFTCQAFYDFYDVNKEPKIFYYYVHLNVRVPVSKPFLLLSDASPIEGSIMWMRCSLENGTEPIQYMWQHETRNGNITVIAQGSSSIINVTGVNRNHTGWYRCVARNDVNSESSNRLWLDTIYGPDLPEINVTPYTITERGYSALERETVSLLCQAPSNPASQYVWFYNNSQVYTGPQLTITKILRMHTGEYACLAQNTYLNTRSKKTISLTVYYPPDGSPSCTVEAALNHSSLRLICSWPGGFPSPALRWKEDFMQDPSGVIQQINPLNRTAIMLPPKGLTSSNSLFTCVGTHPTLMQTTECSTRGYLPAAEPVCFAYVTNNKQYLMLSCSWDGGVPKALVWWEGPEGQSKAGQENSNILVLRYGTARSGKPYTCYAQHPLLVQPMTCKLTLEAPVLLTQRRVVSVYEGSDVQLTCNLRANYLPVNEITWFNNRGADTRDTSKYMLLRTSGWANLTVRDTDETQDSGEYRCSTSNAVGGAEINVTLVVNKHPMPPNATLLRVTYNSKHRNQVELEWQVEPEEKGEWTGFLLEHRLVYVQTGNGRGTNASLEKMGKIVVSKFWFQNLIQEPDVRFHTVQGLTPTYTYQFRIMAINHRTIGHPSATRTPAEPSSNMYPAVIGAAIGGMLFAAILTVLLLVYIIRNRNNNPRLHDMLFGSQHSQSRENINFPEDEVVNASEAGDEIGGASSSSGPAISIPRAASPLATPPVSATPAPTPASHVPSQVDENEPVSVTITVKASGS